MESIVINVLLGFWVALFGAMAIVPFVLEGRRASQAPVEDDRIISIQPVAMPQAASRVHASIPTTAPGHREAA